MAFWVAEDEDSRFYFLQRMYMICGNPIWDIKSYSYTLFSTVSITCAYVTLLTIIIGIMKNLDDLEYVFESVRASLAMINILWTSFFLSLKKEGLKNLMAIAKNFTWSDLTERDPETGSYTMAGLIPRIQKFIWYGNIIVLSLHTIYSTFRVLMGNNYLFFNAWSPGDLSYLPNQIGMLLIQAFASLMLCFYAFAFIGLFAVVMAVAITQLEKLHSKIMNMKSGTLSPSELNSQLAEFILHHQTVLKYMNEMQTTFNVVSLGPLLSVAVTLCIAAFTAITMQGSLVENIQVSLVVFTFMMQVQSMCFFGTELTTMSGKVREAVYSSDWIGTPLPYQKYLLFIMTASKEFVLMAGMTIPISRETMMTVMNEAYTFLMFLLNVMG